MGRECAKDSERPLLVERTGHDIPVAERVRALAEALVEDYDVTELLHQLIYTCLDLLPFAQAGLLLRDPRQRSPRLLASTGHSARMLELYQLEDEEGGPCVQSVSTGKVVSVDDLGAHGLPWPRFAARAVDAGFLSVLAVPLRVRKNVIGAINLFSHDVATLGRDWSVPAQALADLSTIAIVQQSVQQGVVQESARVTEQLQAALDGRMVIEQAKGILAEHAKVDMDVAFRSLRSYSRGSNLRLSEVAASLATGTRDPAEVMNVTPPRS